MVHPVAVGPAHDRFECDVVAARPLADDRLERDVVEEVDVPERLALPGSERWTSMNGRWTPSSASRSETLVWVSPPALTIATSKSRSCRRSISAPSWFDWKKRDREPELIRARAAIPAWISSSVS